MTLFFAGLAAGLILGVGATIWYVFGAFTEVPR